MWVAGPLSSVHRCQLNRPDSCQDFHRLGTDLGALVLSPGDDQAMYVGDSSGLHRCSVSIPNSCSLIASSKFGVPLLSLVADENCACVQSASAQHLSKARARAQSIRSSASRSTDAAYLHASCVCHCCLVQHIALCSAMYGVIKLGINST